MTYRDATRLRRNKQVLLVGHRTCVSATAPTSSVNETQRCSDLHNVFPPAPKIPWRLFLYYVSNYSEAAGASVQYGQLFGPLQLISGPIIIATDATAPKIKAARPQVIPNLLTKTKNGLTAPVIAPPAFRPYFSLTFYFFHAYHSEGLAGGQP